MTQRVLEPIPANTPPADMSALKTAWPRRHKATVALTGLFGTLLAVFVLSLAVGSVNIPVAEIVTVLLGGEPSRATWTNIVIDFRLPKAITAALAGAALGVSGLQMQTFFRNPLAEPYVLGINAGASLGVALVVLSVGTTGSILLAGLGFLGDFGLVLASAVGAGLVLVLVIFVAQRVRSTITLLILGLMFGYATGALVTILLHFSISERIRAFINWTFGSFGGVTWSQMQIFVPAIVCGLALSIVMVKPLNALLLGEAYARTMGLNVKRARLGIITSTAVLAGAVTAFCGPIGFIGIAVPHLCRGLFGTSDHRVLVPATAMMGGVVAITADLVAGVPGSQIVLPLNAVTAMIGAPVVIWIILSRRYLRESFGS